MTQTPGLTAFFHAMTLRPAAPFMSGWGLSSRAIMANINFRAEIIEPNAPEHKPWGMYEFALSDPDETLVRVGWPSNLAPKA